MEIASPGQVVSGYRPLEVLGEGGMGVSFIAASVSERSPALVVIKRPHPHLLAEPTARKRFYHEALVATRLSHPHLVRTLVSGEDVEGPYLVLEYVHGVTLEDLLDRAVLRGRQLPTEVVVAMLGQSVRGAAALHAATDDDGEPLNVVHRDISAQNILLGAGGRAKLADFGIAKSRLLSVSTDASDLLGRIVYLAPEYLTGRESGSAGDVYALGVTSFLSLTGHLPFEASSEAQLIQQKLGGRPVELTGAGTAVPHGLCRLVDAMLARHPDDRPTTDDILGALESFTNEAAWPGAIAGAVDHYAGRDLAARVDAWRARAIALE